MTALLSCRLTQKGLAAVLACAGQAAWLTHVRSGAARERCRGRTDVVEHIRKEAPLLCVRVQVRALRGHGSSAQAIHAESPRSWPNTAPISYVAPQPLW